MQGIISQNFFGWVIPALLLLKCVGSLVLFMFLDATVEMSDLYCCLWSSMVEIIGKSRFTRSLSYVKFQPKKIVQK